MKLKNCLWRYKMNLQENARIKEAVNKPSHYVGEKGLEVKEVLEKFC